VSILSYDFRSFLRYDELAAWLHALAAAHPRLLTVSAYGRSHEGRALLLATLTDAQTGPHDAKPAHWVDANIHATEVTGGVAALYLIHALVTRHAAGEPVATEALRTRTFYVAPRVNPDGVEAALGSRPRHHRSSVRPWPWPSGHRWPGLHPEDVDGDGRVLQMRVPDPDGAWVEHPEEPRVLTPVGPLGAPEGARRYRVFTEGLVEAYDGFTVPAPRDPAGLDLNRNFPVGWSRAIPGAGDHPLSEPEVDALVRAICARPNVCGYNAFHTSGGMLLRPSSSAPDSTLPPVDLKVFASFGAHFTPLTTYPVYSVFESVTWDPAKPMGGVADDWAYEHLGVYAWTTEFWDAIYRVTGVHSTQDLWYMGPTPEQHLAMCRWCDARGVDGYVPWRPFAHPQLGPVELGGVDAFRVWVNAPACVLKEEVAPHADVAIYQALASPRLEVKGVWVDELGGGLWRVRAGVANVGWLGTEVTQWARDRGLVLPITLELSGVEVVEGEAGGGGERGVAGHGGDAVGARPRPGAAHHARALRRGGGGGGGAVARWAARRARGVHPQRRGARGGHPRPPLARLGGARGARGRGGGDGASPPLRGGGGAGAGGGLRWPSRSGWTPTPARAPSATSSRAPRSAGGCWRISWRTRR